MSEDKTKNLHGGGSFEERILAELSTLRADLGGRFDSLEKRVTSVGETRFDSIEKHLASFESRFDSVETRLTSLEDKVDARLRETRPIWESVQAELKEIGKQLVTFNRQFKRLIQDSFNLSVRVEALEDSQPET